MLRKTRVTFSATRDGITSISVQPTVRKLNIPRVNIDIPQQPIWYNMLSIEWDFTRMSSAYKAMIALTDIRNKFVYTTKS